MVFESRGGRAWSNATGSGPVSFSGSESSNLSPCNPLNPTTSKSSDPKLSKPAKPEFDAFLDGVKESCMALSFHDMIELKSEIHKIYLKRFKQKPKEPKYGSINKGFTELELQHFLRNAPSEKFRLLFKYQAFLGLRVGEVCKLHIGNIDFEKRELTIKSEKRQKSDTLRIPLNLFKETYEFISKNLTQIRSANGYIFFKGHGSHSDLTHVDKNYIRNVFRRTVKKINLEKTYDYSDETLYKRKPRQLHRLTTHSLRHYAITHFAKATNGNIVLASRFARHSNTNMTLRYIGKDSEELNKNIDFAFETSSLEKIRILASEFKSNSLKLV